MTMQRGDLSEGSIEQEIQNKGLNAPRLTPQHIDAQIVAEHYWLVPGTTTIVCSLVLQNGFVVTGHASCASAANFDHTIGRKIAFDDARDNIWQLEGYRLKQMLWEQEEAARAVAEATAENVERMAEIIETTMAHKNVNPVEEGEELEPALPLGLA